MVSSTRNNGHDADILFTFLFSDSLEYTKHYQIFYQQYQLKMSVLAFKVLMKI